MAELGEGLGGEQGALARFAGLAAPQLRCRSAYSLLRGAIHAKDLAKLAAAAGMPALGLTDETNLFGALEFSESCAAAGVQPVIGLTLPVRFDPPALGARAHPDGVLVLYAQNDEGYRRLMALSSKAYLDTEGGGEPHVPWEAIAADTGGLIALTGGPAGALDRALRLDQADIARRRLEQLAAAFGGRLYVELQRRGQEREADIEAGLVDMAYGLGLPLAATNDVFFAKAEQARAHDALICIAEGAYLGAKDRERSGEAFAMPADASFRSLFADCPEALSNAFEIAQRTAFRPTPSRPLLPSFASEEGRDEAEELRVQAEEGLTRRLDALEAQGVLAADRAAYSERLAFELDVIAQMGFPGYFLIVSDFIKWAKRNGVSVGPGRGSGAGSLVAYALEITNLDPLRFGLLFERFLNPERVSMPDFDVDFCQERRGEVIRYVQERYGSDRVAQIITFGTLQARAVVRDVGRVMQLPFGFVDKLAKLIPNNPANPTTLGEAIEIEPRIRELARAEEGGEELLGIALQLEGLYRNASTHAAGVVIADRPLTELCPLYQDPRSDLPATQFNMKWVEIAGLVKFDFLGLKTLTVIERALDFIERETGERPDLDALGFGDPSVYSLLASGQTVGVFQLEGQGMRDTLRKMKPDAIEDIIALISLYRPGPMKNIDTYVARKFGREEPDYLHPDLKPVLEETYGVIIYQEQVMQIARILAGYSLGEADILRRAMGKKKPEEMAQQRARFVEGAAKNGVDKAKADFIFDLVAEFAGYGFNKSHAAAYAVIAYQTAWLKANHPGAFFAGSMSLDAHNTDKLAVFVQDARRFGIEVAPPDANRSSADFNLDGGAIRYALGAVKNVGMEAMRQLERAREEGGPFRDLIDLAERMDPRVMNKKAFENLAKSGAFDSLGAHRAQAHDAAEFLARLCSKAEEDRAASQSSLFGAEDDAGARPDLPNAAKWSAQKALDAEFAAIGFYLSGHPLDGYAASFEERGITLSAAAGEAFKAGQGAFRMAGVVRGRNERVSQRTGKRFAFLMLSDPTGDFEAFVPGELLAQARDVMEEGALVWVDVTAKADGDSDEARYFAENVTPLLERLDGRPPPGLIVRVSEHANPARLAAALLEFCRAAKGPKGYLELRAPLSEGGWAVLRAAEAAPVGAEWRMRFMEIDGVEAVSAAPRSGDETQPSQAGAGDDGRLHRAA